MRTSLPIAAAISEFVKRQRIWIAMTSEHASPQMILFSSVGNSFLYRSVFYFRFLATSIASTTGKK